jgi:hypothetical protein
MSFLATGTFTVKMAPLPSENLSEVSPGGVRRARMALDKVFSGDLLGTGQGEMLSAITATQGSAGYVAMELVVASLHGREGSFVFQHTGTMDRGAQQLAISVVPDSGSGALAGLSGQFRIRIEGGQHYYEFEYQLPPA